MTVHRVFFRSLSVLCRDPCAPRLIAFNSHCFSPRLSSTDSGIIQDESKLDSSSSSSSSTASSKSYKAAEMMPVPKPLFGKKALMKLRKKTGFSMSQCRKVIVEGLCSEYQCMAKVPGFGNFRCLYKSSPRILVWQVEQYPSLNPNCKTWKRTLWALTDSSYYAHHS